MVISAVTGASGLVEEMGISHDLSIGQFSMIAGVFLVNMMAFFDHLTDARIELTDSTVNFEAECASAFNKLRQKNGHVSVTHAVFKNR
jgi:hypothetical protein